MKPLFLASLILATYLSSHAPQDREAYQFCTDEASETQGESERTSNADYINQCVSDALEDL